MPYPAGRAVAVALAATVMRSRSSGATPDPHLIAEQVLAQVASMPDFLRDALCGSAFSASA